MLIRDEVVTPAAPDRLWALIADPGLHSLWNPRIVATEIVGGGPPASGFRYRTTYELNGRRSGFDAEITAFEPGRRWAARLEEREKGDGRNWNRFMEESYEISPRGSRTHVRHEVRIHHSGVPAILRLLIWIVMRTGAPRGRTYMQQLATLAEEEAARAAGA